MALNPNPRPAFTPAACDWLVYQFVSHALPALESELRLLQKYRAMVVHMLDEKHLNVEQRAELTFILDQLAQRRLIFNGADEHPQDRKGSDDHE